jgi:hypothetical protein
MKFILVTLIFFQFFVLKAQTDIDYFFEDGGLSTSTTTLKTNIFSPINGAYSLSCEKRFFSKFGLEIGVNHLSNYYYPEFSTLTGSDPDMDFETNGGIGYFIQPKIYKEIYQSKQFKKYYGVLFRQRFYELLNHQKRTHTDIGVIVGLYQDFGGRVVIDYSTGIMYRTYRYSSLFDANDQLSNFIGVLAIKIGIKI